MARRVTATILWAYFGWFLFAMGLTAVGAPTTFAFLGGIAIAGLAQVDWRSFKKSPAYEISSVSE